MWQGFIACLCAWFHLFSSLSSSFYIFSIASSVGFLIKERDAKPLEADNACHPGVFVCFGGLCSTASLKVADAFAF